jgi:hypothetical protein
MIRTIAEGVFGGASALQTSPLSIQTGPFLIINRNKLFYIDISIFPLRGKIEMSLDRGSTLPKVKKKRISPTALVL